MADPASLLANQNFAPLVTDPNLRSLLIDPDFSWRMRGYLRERQLEIEAQQEPPPVYVLQPSWPDLYVWERKVNSIRRSYLKFITPFKIRVRVRLDSSLVPFKNVP